jgi:hypothetical protein
MSKRSTRSPFDAPGVRVLQRIDRLEQPQDPMMRDERDLGLIEGMDAGRMGRPT